MASSLSSTSPAPELSTNATVKPTSQLSATPSHSTDDPMPTHPPTATDGAASIPPLHPVADDAEDENRDVKASKKETGTYTKTSRGMDDTDLPKNTRKSSETPSSKLIEGSDERSNEGNTQDATYDKRSNIDVAPTFSASKEESGTHEILSDNLIKGSVQCSNEGNSQGGTEGEDELRIEEDEGDSEDGTNDEEEYGGGGISEEEGDGESRIQAEEEYGGCGVSKEEEDGEGDLAVEEEDGEGDLVVEEADGEGDIAVEEEDGEGGMRKEGEDGERGIEEDEEYADGGSHEEKQDGSHVRIAMIKSTQPEAKYLPWERRRWRNSHGSRRNDKTRWSALRDSIHTAPSAAFAGCSDWKTFLARAARGAGGPASRSVVVRAFIDLARSSLSPSFVDTTVNPSHRGELVSEGRRDGCLQSLNRNSSFVFVFSLAVQPP